MASILDLGMHSFANPFSLLWFSRSPTLSRCLCSGKSSRRPSPTLEMSSSCCHSPTINVVKGKQTKCYKPDRVPFVPLFYRENSVMFSVTFWQWVQEVTFSFIFHFYIYYLMGTSKFMGKFWTIVVQLHIVILNIFYLFGDSQFQRNVTEVGIFKAVRNALLQSYE